MLDKFQGHWPRKQFSSFYFHFNLYKFIFLWCVTNIVTRITAYFAFFSSEKFLHCNFMKGKPTSQVYQHHYESQFLPFILLFPYPFFLTPFPLLSSLPSFLFFSPPFLSSLLGSFLPSFLLYFHQHVFIECLPYTRHLEDKLTYYM